MNEWLIAALVLLVALVPAGAVCLLRPAIDGLVGVELAGVVAAVILLLLSEGTHRQPFADLAIVMAFLSFGGALAFVRFLDREP